MAQRITNAVGVLYSRIFAERQIYIRSNGEMQYLTLSSRVQAVAALGVVAVIGWALATTVVSLLHVGEFASREYAIHRVRASYGASLEKMRANYAALEAELDESERRFDQVLARMNGRFGQLETAAGVESALKSRLASMRRRLAVVTKQRDAFHTQLSRTRTRTDALSGELTEAQLRESQLKTTLAAISGALKTTALERDTVSENSQKLQKQKLALEADLSATRERQEQIMTQLEEAARVSLSELGRIVKKSGVDIDKVLDSVESEYKGAGGPFVPVASSRNGVQSSVADEANTNRVASLLHSLERVSMLRIAVDKMPLGLPTYKYRITSGYGIRKDPVNGHAAFHKGLDMAGPLGTPIYASAGGVVTFAGRQRGFGNVIEIRHALGFETVYGHLRKIRVVKGQNVARRDRIGDMGSTGRSTGSHLHYEIRMRGKTINPLKFIEAGRNVF